MVRGIHHVALSTPDLGRMVGFYRDLIGFEEVVLDFAWDVDNVVGPRVMRTGGPSAGRAVMLRAGNAFLEVFEFDRPVPRPGDPERPVVDHGITHLCIDVDDVHAEYARLSAAGVVFHCPPQPMGAGIHTTYARDPDGNVFEVQQIPTARHKCALPPLAPTPGVPMTQDTTLTPILPALEFPGYAFLEVVRDALNADPEFGRATAWFDGSVLLRLGDLAVWMKWYRGHVIDMHEGPDLLGCTFSLSAPAAVWRGIIELPRTSYRPWAKLFQFGEIATEGNIVEATRVLEAQFILASHIHEIGNRTGRA